MIRGYTTYPISASPAKSPPRRLTKSRNIIKNLQCKVVALLQLCKKISITLVVFENRVETNTNMKIT
eukprot:UN02877